MDIIVKDGGEPDFWSVIGPLATNERIVKAVGKPLVHGVGKTWFIARDEDGRVAGFATMRLDTGMVPFIEFPEFHVEALFAGRTAQLMSDRRRRREFGEGSGPLTGPTADALSAARLREAWQRWPGLPVRVTVPAGETRPDLEHAGFKLIANKGKTATWELRWSDVDPPQAPAERPRLLSVRELDGDAEIHRVLGPFAMSRDVTKALGLCLVHEDGKRWFVAEKGRVVLGFACLEPGRADTMHLRHSYVLPEHQGNGVYGALLDHRLKICAGKRVLTVATAASKPILEKRGFIPDPGVTRKSQYTTMLLDLRETVA